VRSTWFWLILKYYRAIWRERGRSQQVSRREEINESDRKSYWKQFPILCLTSDIFEATEGTASDADLHLVC